MDTQTAFDIVMTHLWNQNGVSRKPFGGGCAYRGQRGTKCAIGCLIPDHLYNRGMEGSSVSVLLNVNPEVAALPSLQALCVTDACGVPLHLTLQRLHDQYICSEIPSFRMYLREMAASITRRYKLTLNLPKE
jgi:hypothetical protein